MNVSNYNLIHSASLLFCNTFLVYLSISHIILKNKQKNRTWKYQSITNSTHAMYTLSRQEKKRKEKGNMIIWIAINNPPILTLMSQYQPIFWVSEIKEPINFLLLLLQLRKQSFAKQTRVFVPPILIIIHHDWIEIQHLWYVRVQSILNHGFRRSNKTFIWEFFC